MKMLSKKINLSVIKVALLSLMITISTSCNLIYASDIFSDIKSTSKTFYNQLIDIALPLAIIAFIVCLILALFTTNPNESAKWIGLAKKAVVIYIAILLAASVLLYAKDTFHNYSEVQGIWN